MIAAIDRGATPKKVNPAGGQPNGAKTKWNKPDYTSNQDNNQHLSFSIVRQAAHGKWESIHRAIGVNLITLSHLKHTACPGCGGKDRFRVLPDYVNTGRWFCGGGGDNQSGDGFSLLGHVFGLTPQQQLKAVADYLGLSQMDNSERAKIKAIADRQAAQMAEDAQRKHEQYRRDHNILDAIADFEDALNYRWQNQKTVNGINGRFVFLPTDWEISTFRSLIKLGIECYGDLINKGVQDA